MKVKSSHLPGLVTSLPQLITGLGGPNGSVKNADRHTRTESHVEWSLVLALAKNVKGETLKFCSDHLLGFNSYRSAYLIVQIDDTADLTEHNDHTDDVMETVADLKSVGICSCLSHICPKMNEAVSGVGGCRALFL